MKPLKRRLGAVNYISAGSTSRIELPRNYNYRSLICRIAGSVVVSGGSGAGAVHALAAYKAIRRIEIVVDGRDTLMSVDPAALSIINRADYGCVPSASNPSNDAAATYTFNASFIIDFQTKRGKNPIDTIFPAAGLTTFDMVITWGAGADMFTGAVDFTSAAIQTTSTLAVQTFEEIGDASKVVGGVKKLFTSDKEITASGSNFQVEIAEGNLIQNLLLHFKDAEVPSDGILNDLSLEAGTEVFQKWLSDDEILDYNKLQFGLETSLSGFMFIDFLDSDGFLSEILDTKGLSDLKFVMNVTKGSGTTRCLSYPTEMVIPRKG